MTKRKRRESRSPTRRMKAQSHQPGPNGRFSASLLRHVLRSRLQRLVEGLQHDEHDDECLATVAVSVTEAEQAMGISYDIPHPLYERLEGGRMKCQFHHCQNEISNPYNFSVHLKRNHSQLQQFLESTICLLCGTDHKSSKGLIAHERAEHNASYKSRPEIFAPFFPPFRDKTQCIEALRSSSTSSNPSSNPSHIALEISVNPSTPSKNSSRQPVATEKTPLTINEHSHTHPGFYIAPVDPSTPYTLNGQNAEVWNNETNTQHVDFGLELSDWIPSSPKDIIPCSIEPTEVSLCVWDPPPELTYIDWPLN